MEDAAHRPSKPFNQIFDLNGAFPSSSPHSNDAFPNFHAGSSSSRCLSRPRMIKHRKRHVAAVMEKFKDSSLGKVEPPKHEDGVSPHFFGPNSGRDASGSRSDQCGTQNNDSFSQKDASFPPTSSYCSGFAPGVGGDKDFKFKFVQGRASLHNGSVRNIRRWVHNGDRTMNNVKMKNYSFGEKIDARLDEVMKKLNIQNHQGKPVMHKLEELGPLSKNDHGCSSSVAPNVFVSGSNKSAHDGHDDRIGGTSQSSKDGKENLKENVSIFGSIWTKNTYSSLNKTVTTDDCTVKLPDDVVNPAASGQNNGSEPHNGNILPRVNRKNAHLYSNRMGCFGKNAIKEEANFSSEGTEKILNKQSREIPFDDSTTQESNSWKFMFRTVKQDSSAITQCSHSIDLNSVMPNDPTDGRQLPLSSNSQRDTSFESLPKTDAPYFDFGVPKIYTCKEEMFSAMQQSLSFDKHKGAMKDSRQRKMFQKTRQSSAVHQKASDVFTVPEGNDLDGNSDAASSPMDFSPFKDIQCPVQYSKEGVIELDDPTFDVPLPTLADTVSSLNNLEKSEFYKHVSSAKYPAVLSCTSDQTTEQGQNMSEFNICINQENASIIDFSNSINLKNECSQAFSFFSSMDDCNLSNFTFATLSSTQGPLSGSKRLLKKKKQKRVSDDVYNSEVNRRFNLASLSVDLFPPENAPVKLDLAQCEVPKGVLVDSESKKEQEYEAKETPIVEEAAVSSVARKACEKWRVRGNKAYETGNVYKAEKYYTRGLQCLSPDKCSANCIQALVLCYSNRAAARMSLGKIREALEDCLMATSMDPVFFRAQIRAANCHLVLGETEDASKIYRSCLQAGANAKIDARLLKEASDGLFKSQLSCYEEVIKLCEDTLESAERNYSQIGTMGQYKDYMYENACTSSKLWRLNLISKSYFYMGRLEEAIDLLKKHGVVCPAPKSCDDESLESLSLLSATMQELLRMKAAGNTAFQSGRYSEAVEHYTASFSGNIVSRPFAAICFCNRAAGYQALGQLTDAIADCNLAIALNANYCKAISRRATLHEMIRNYGQASVDMRLLISILERQVDHLSGTSGKCVDTANNLRRARSRLATVEDESRKGIPLDMYKILGLESSSSAIDIKKAYRKAALKHHPDKALQLLVRNENAHDILWNDLAAEVRKDADCIFKMVGEAYAVLSDPSKRSEYDAEEMTRTSFKENSWHDTNSSHCQSGSFRNRSKESWKSYGHSDFDRPRSYRSRW